MKTTPRLFLLFVASICLALHPAIRCQAHSAVEPAPRNDPRWQGRHKAINENVARVGAQSQVIFIGDSITEGWEGAGRDAWARHYAHRNALNLGIGGDRTQHVLWRLDNGNLDGLQPKAAVVMIGTNNSNGEDNSVEQIADGVAAIVAKLRQKLPATKIVLLAIFPRSENPTSQRGKILQVNQIIRKLADGQNVYWQDFGHKFIESDGSIPVALMPDYLHLSPQAYEIWAQSIERRLSSIIGDQPVSAAASSASELSGAWVAAIPGPNGDPVDSPFSLKQEGEKLTGEFERPGATAMKIENGKISGQAFSWTLRRPRPDGSVMTYEMSGTAEGTRLTGKASTTLEGNLITIDWTAKRR